MAEKISVDTLVEAPIEKVWEYWTMPEYITKWCAASEDWHAPRAENDLREGGRFMTRMEAKDGSVGFDFTGIYTDVVEHKVIEYDMDKATTEDMHRHVKIEFIETPAGVQIIETFDPENENSLEMQRAGWQAILENFKRYVETQ